MAIYPDVNYDNPVVLKASGSLDYKIITHALFFENQLTICGMNTGNGVPFEEPYDLTSLSQTNFNF